MDTSVVVAVLFQEPGWEVYQRVMARADAVVSSLLLEAEVYAAVVREGFPIASAVNALGSISLAFPDRSLALEYAEIYSIGHCRGADAHHVATALYLDPPRKELRFLTADRQQARIARRLGFRV